MTDSVQTHTERAARLAQLQEHVGLAGFDAAAVVPGTTFSLLTGRAFYLSKRPLVLIIPSRGEAAVIIPRLELARLADDPPFPMRFFVYTDDETYRPAFAKACSELGLAGAKLAVEGVVMRVIESQALLHYAPGCSIHQAEDTITEIRLRKGPRELAAMRKAIAISEAALDDTVKQVRPGMTEKQVMTHLLGAMRAHGGAANAFDPIVLAGPRSALPHGESDDTVINAGDLLLFDYGTTSDGYPADITRTFAVGQIDPELEKVYNIVLEANETGIRTAKPGIQAQVIDRAVRKVIVDAGYGEYFIHRTGHGLGLDIHEAPYIREGNDQILEPGMVFTIEPGIYLPGKGGVRIEDNVTITEGGAEVLTSYPKSFRVIGG